LSHPAWNVHKAKNFRRTHNNYGGGGGSQTGQKKRREDTGKKGGNPDTCLRGEHFNILLRNRGVKL